VPEPRFEECKYLLLELYRLESIGGPSIEIGDSQSAKENESWEYIPDVEAPPYLASPGSFHSQVIVGLAIAAPTVVYRHVLGMARRPGRDKYQSPGVGFSALSAIRLLPRCNRHRSKILRVLAEIAYANIPPDFKALVCYEIALQLCHEGTDQSLNEAASWLNKGFKAIWTVADDKQTIWEVRLRNCDAFCSYLSGDSESALRKLRAMLSNAAARSSCSVSMHNWSSAIVMTNIARILQRKVGALPRAIEYWREVERVGSGSQREHALGEQVKAQVRLGRLDEAFAKAGEYCGKDNYMSIHLDWELALRRVYCLTAVRTHSPDRPTEQDVDRVGELEWWCRGALVT
jgi:hypothetical protein